MKKFLLPAMFVIALAGSAFTRYSSTHAASKRSVVAYYQSAWDGMCTSWIVDDDNCVQDDLNYLCYEMVSGQPTCTMMFQNEFGSTCYQPYYSYYPNFPGCY